MNKQITSRVFLAILAVLVGLQQPALVSAQTASIGDSQPSCLDQHSSRPDISVSNNPH